MLYIQFADAKCDIDRGGKLLRIPIPLRALSVDKLTSSTQKRCGSDGKEYSPESIHTITVNCILLSRGCFDEWHTPYFGLECIGCGEHQAACWVKGDRLSYCIQCS
jgi:hypothetical protein